jgi:hypothetical protein
VNVVAGFPLVRQDGWPTASPDAVSLSPKRLKEMDDPVAFMGGNGGNKVAIVPDLDLVAVLTSTNYNTKGMHEQTDRLLGEYVIAAGEVR